MNNLKIVCVCGADLANKHKVQSTYKPVKFAHVVANCFEKRIVEYKVIVNVKKIFY